MILLFINHLQPKSYLFQLCQFHFKTNIVFLFNFFSYLFIQMIYIIFAYLNQWKSSLVHFWYVPRSSAHFFHEVLIYFGAFISKSWLLTIMNVYHKPLSFFLWLTFSTGWRRLDVVFKQINSENYKVFLSM